MVLSQWGFSNLASRSGLFGGMITRGMTKSILKTNKAAAKRFRVKGNGELKRYVHVHVHVQLTRNDALLYEK